MSSLLIALLFCCQKNLNEKDKFELECISLFEDILNIQDERDLLNNNMQHISGLRKQKNINKKKYKAISDEWFKKETYLRNKVTKLYDKAYNDGCFEERTNNLEEK